LTLPVDLATGIRYRAVADGGSHYIPALGASQTSHQPLDITARYLDVVLLRLLPDFVRTINTQPDVPRLTDQQRQFDTMLRPGLNSA